LFFSWLCDFKRDIDAGAAITQKELLEQNNKITNGV
jgi:hypothetical protein